MNEYDDKARGRARSDKDAIDESSSEPSLEPGKMSVTQLVFRRGGSSVQRVATGAASAPKPEQALAAAAGSSSTGLVGALRGRLETALGTGLGDVRVHTGPESAQAASAIGARAYTTGQDIHFGTGQYQPGTPDGDRLVAHEVVHTVQQRGASAAPQTKLEVSQPGDAAEHEADSIADSIMTGAPVPKISATPTGAVHRTPHVMRPDVAHPEHTPVQITGTYEALDPTGDNRITLELNQAGTHFEGWWQRRAMRAGSGARMEHRRIVGDVTSSAPDTVTFSYQRFIEGGTPMPGTLTARGTGDSFRVHLSEGAHDVAVDDRGQIYITGWDHDFRRTSEAPRLSEQGIQSLPAEAQELARASVDAPLDSDEDARIQQSGDYVMRRIRDWLDAARGVARDAHAAGLNEAISSLFHNHPAEQFPLVRQRL